MALGRIGMNPNLADEAINHGIGAAYGAVAQVALTRGRIPGAIVMGAPIVAKLMTTGNSGWTARLIDSTSMASAGAVGFTLANNYNLNSRLPFGRAGRRGSPRGRVNNGGANYQLSSGKPANTGAHNPRASVVGEYNGHERRYSLSG